jgi:hypothetical protein
MWGKSCWSRLVALWIVMVLKISIVHQDSLHCELYNLWGHCVLQLQAQTLGARAVHSQPQKFQGYRGRGCVSGCGHLALELSCPDARAIPASCLLNQVSGVCWQDPFMLGQASKPSCLGSECKPQTQNKHS